MKGDSWKEEWRMRGQEHAVRIAELSAHDESASAQLRAAVDRISLDAVEAAYRCAVKQARVGGGDGGSVDLRPLEAVAVGSRAGAPESEREEWWRLGVEAVRAGRVAALCLAGGQGSRLGSPVPKGLFDCGLPSRRSLFELQAARLRKVAELCAPAPPLRWYLLTSSSTDGVTRAFFEQHAYFGLRRDDVVFFEQPDLPALDEHGRVLFASPTAPVMAPNGNGGLYDALASCGVLDDLESHGIDFLSQYCVDNVLVRPVDPFFVGFCIQRGLDVAAKVVPKRDPSERVGVVCRADGRFAVVEYSEISEELAQRRDPDSGELVFRDAHLCMNMFRRDFLALVARDKRAEMPYHVAKRTVACIAEDGSPRSVVAFKLEKFIFDCFGYSRSPGAFQIPREEEFSPLKNAPGSHVLDSPDTCLHDLNRMFRSWVLASGGAFADDAGPDDGIFEIAPEVSLNGEGLTDRVRGRIFHRGETLT
jgi:UDP-N-acetylglucosamine/UDP-N-acetylgalactosamine diphosphorylase